jgi:dipeptidyl aminopeptidase/acylaminoacyl peptidase
MARIDAASGRQPLPAAGPTELLRDFLEVRSTFAVDISSDGGTALVVSNLSGTMQLYTVSAAAGHEMIQLTDLDDPCTGRLVPGSGDVIVSVDQGGNERHQLHLLAEPRGALRPLVVDPDHIHLLGGISRDGSLISYASNRRNGVDFDIYVRDLRSGEERCVFDRGSWCHAGGFSPDGRFVAVSQPTELTMDNDLFLCDLGGGEIIHASPHDGDAFFGEPAWLEGGDAFLFATDAGRDVSAVARYEMAARTWRYLGESSWDVDCWTDPQGRRALVVSNEDGYSRIDLFEASSMRPLRRLRLPSPGVVGTGYPAPPPRFSDDASRLVVSHQSAAEAGDAWLVDVDGGGWSRLTNSPRDVPVEDCVEPELHRVPSFDGEPIPAFLYRPAHLQDKQPPVVVHIHGGPESQHMPTFNPVIQYLVARGYAVLAPNVRGSTGYGKRFHHLDDRRLRLNSVRDLAALHAWLPSAGLDASRAVLYGGSYGGYMVLAGLAFQPELWAAGVDIVGISSLVTFLENTAPWRRRIREREYGFLDEDRDFLLDASPLSHVDRIRAPLFIIHGSNDPRVPLGEAEQMHRVLSGKGIPTELLVYPDEGHGLARLNNRLDAYPRVAEFLDRVLRADS